MVCTPVNAMLNREDSPCKGFPLVHRHCRNKLRLSSFGLFEMLNGRVTSFLKNGAVISSVSPFKVEADVWEPFTDSMEESSTGKECLDLQIDNSRYSLSYPWSVDVVRRLQYLIRSSIVFTMPNDTNISVSEVSDSSWESGPDLVLASDVHVPVEAISNSGISLYVEDTSSTKTLQDDYAAIAKNGRGPETYIQCLPKTSKPKFCHDGSIPNHFHEPTKGKSSYLMIISTTGFYLDTNCFYDLSERFPYCVIYVWSFDPGITQIMFGVYGIFFSVLYVVLRTRLDLLGFRDQPIQDDNNAWLLSAATLFQKMSCYYIMKICTHVFIWEPGPLILLWQLDNLWPYTSWQHGLLFLTSKVPNIVKSSHILRTAVASVYAHEQDNRNICGEIGGALTLHALPSDNYRLDGFAESTFSCLSECIPKHMSPMPIRNVMKLSIDASDDTIFQAFRSFLAVTVRYIFLEYADPRIHLSILTASIYNCSCRELYVWDADQGLWQHILGTFSYVQWKIAWYISIWFPAWSSYHSVNFQKSLGIYHTRKKEIAEVNILAIHIGIGRVMVHVFPASPTIDHETTYYCVCVYVEFCAWSSFFTRIWIQLRLHMVRTMVVPVRAQVTLFSWISLFQVSELMWVSKIRMLIYVFGSLKIPLNLYISWVLKSTLSYLEIISGVFRVFLSVHKEHIYSRLIVKAIHGAADDLLQKTYSMACISFGSGANLSFHFVIIQKTVPCEIQQISVFDSGIPSSYGNFCTWVEYFILNTGIC